MSSTVPLLRLESVDSTNRYVREHVAELADGTFVLAREQTAGRGRRERKWNSPAGVNVTGTLCVKTDGVPFHTGCVVSLAALKTLREAAPELDFFVKWPNDIYCGDAKIAGILCESCGFSGGRMIGIAAGIGINVNMGKEDIEAISDNRAVSLRTAAGRIFHLEKFIDSLAKSLFEYYSIYCNDSSSLIRQWRAENRLVGEQIELQFDDGSRLEGVFHAIAEDGGLELREPSGRLRRFACADVRIDRSKIDFERLKRKINNHR